MPKGIPLRPSHQEMSRFVDSWDCARSEVPWNEGMTPSLRRERVLGKGSVQGREFLLRQSSGRISMRLSLWIPVLLPDQELSRYLLLRKGVEEIERKFARYFSLLQT